MNIVLEADDRVTTHKVLIEGAVVQDVHPLPRVALVSLDAKGAGSTTIQLHSYLNQTFRVIKAWPSSGDVLKIVPNGRSTYAVTVHNSDMIAGAVPLKRDAFFELGDGSVVSVPVTIFRPPQQERSR